MNSEDRKEVEQNFSEKKELAKSATDEGCDKLREKLAKLEKENAELKDKNLRLLAELVNAGERYKKILKKEIESERDNLIIRFLYIAEDINRVVKAIESKYDPKVITEAIKMIAAKINEFLKLEQIEIIEPNGMPLDPLEYDVVAVEPVDTPELHHKVLKTVQRGYKRGKRLVMPPKVIVGEYKPPEKDSEQSKDNDKNAEKS